MCHRIVCLLVFSAICLVLKQYIYIYMYIIGSLHYTEEHINVYLRFSFPPRQVPSAFFLKEIFDTQTLIFVQRSKNLDDYKFSQWFVYTLPVDAFHLWPHGAKGCFCSAHILFQQVAKIPPSKPLKGQKFGIHFQLHPGNMEPENPWKMNIFQTIMFRFYC